MERLRIVYHGTRSQEAADSITKIGFKPSTYFAKDLGDSVEYGGAWIFEVCIPYEKHEEFFKEEEVWQCRHWEAIPPEMIVAHYIITKKDILNNWKLRMKVHHHALLEMHYCPICGKPIAKQKTREGNFRGLLTMHVKVKHGRLWKGNLAATLENLEEASLSDADSLPAA